MIPGIERANTMKGLYKRKGAEQCQILGTNKTATGRRQGEENGEPWMQEKNSTGMLSSSGFKTT